MSGTAKTEYGLRAVELLSEHCARLSMGDGPSEVVCCLMALFVLLWTGS